MFTINKKVISILSLILSLGIASNSTAYAKLPYERIEGSNRYETAINICNKVTDKTDTVILASGNSYPDGLSAASLAKVFNAPILLTDTSELSKSVKDKIKNIEAKKVIIVGGIGAVSQEIENEINNMNLQCERIGGKDRYETSINIAKRLQFNGKVVLASGNSFADALSIAPIAAKNATPIILTDKNTIPNVVKEYLSDKEIEKTYIIGGQGVISDEVASQVKNPERLGGQNRYETNMRIIKNFQDQLNLENMYIASGEGFADTLTGAILAQKNDSAIFLVSKNMSKESGQAIKEKAVDAKNIYVLGGKGAVDQSSLYMAGIENKPVVHVKPKPIQKPMQKTVIKKQGFSMPAWSSSIKTANTSQANWMYVKSMPGYGNNVGRIYGSLAEIKILGVKGNYYYVEVTDYDTCNRIKGYLATNQVKTSWTSPNYNILVDTNRQKVYIGDKSGKVLRESYCSTGLPASPTPKGRFLVGDKGPSFLTGTNKDVICYNWTRINNNYLFHSVLYWKNGGIIPWENEKLGRKASHGCIRLPLSEAKWIYNNVPRNTLVTIN